MAQLAQSLQEIIIVDSRSEDYAEQSGTLRQLGIDCPLVFCGSGNEAVRIASAARPALWLINAELPDMTGAELYALLRPRLRGKPAFLVADAYDAAYEIAAMQSGGLHFVCKPLAADWLRTVWSDVNRRAVVPLLTPAPLPELRLPTVDGLWSTLSAHQQPFTHL